MRIVNGRAVTSPPRDNGTLNPDLWRTHRANRCGVDINGRRSNRIEAGDLVTWRYAAWRVDEIGARPAVDIPEEDLAELNSLPEWRRNQLWPWTAILRHVRGPVLLADGEFQTLHDGAITCHLGFQMGHHPLDVVDDPYMACSCHGHPWPCQEQDRAAQARYDVTQMAKDLKTTEPDVCASCLEPIRPRQRRVVFPGESLIVPGAPGPVFHALSACWRAAEAYERSGVLARDPNAVRVASCPGMLITHVLPAGSPAEQRDCTAGPACTGGHPPVRRRADCWQNVSYSGPGGKAWRPVPTRDCGWRGQPGEGHGRCGGSVGLPLVADAADQIWARYGRSF